jgi:sugar O-acyltransferase (sialic acid O-acetyltransferase NeuD family)
MLIVGAGGLAMQIFTDLVQMNLKDVVFWSETGTKFPFITDKYPLLSSDKEVEEYFASNSRDFILCVGSSNGARQALAMRFTALGGIASNFISPLSWVSPYGTSFGEGTTILSHVILEPNVKTGEGCLLNKTSNMGHGSILGNYCELAPGVMLMGDVTIGDHCFIGPGAIILPKVKIGHHCIISAGAVIRKDVPDNSLAAPDTVKIVRQQTL